MGRLALFGGTTLAFVLAACSTGGVDSSTQSPSQGQGGESNSSGNSGSSGKGNETGGSSNAGNGGNAGSSDGGTSNSFGGSDGGAGVEIPDSGSPDVLPEGCDGIEQAATRVPLTLYVMLDRSASAAGDHWAAATAGLKAFVQDKSSADINVGLSFFPADPLKFEACSFKNYQDPVVPFGMLPGNAAALVDAINAAKPNGYGSPIYPALGGALERGVSAQLAKPDENFAVLLVTDGDPAKPPAKCGSVNAEDPNEIAKVVDTAYSKYGVRTFVVGLPGVSQSFANLIASKGGTEAIVLKGSVSELEKAFKTALSKVRGESLGCEFPLPPDSTKYNKDMVNVRYTDSTGAVHDLSRSAGCTSGEGWDYDNPNNPTELKLCGATCSTVKDDGLAKIQVVLGCPTRVIN